MLWVRLALVLALLTAGAPAKHRRVEYYSSSGARVLSPFPLYRGPFTAAAGGGLATYAPRPGRAAAGKKDDLRSPQQLFATDEEVRREPSAQLHAASSAGELQSFIRSMSQDQLDALMGLASAHYPRRALSAPRGEEPELEVSHSRAPPPAVARAPSPAPPLYRAERIEHLPLTDYKERPAHLSSYSVPHYSVTSQSSGGAVKAEGAEGESQLKAVGIWTHRSRGAAYTLHPDGTLSLETPPPAAPGRAPGQLDARHRATRAAAHIDHSGQIHDGFSEFLT